MAGNYLGFCDKYGPPKALGAAVAIPVLIKTLSFIAQNEISFDESGMYPLARSALIGAAYGFLSFAVAGAAHSYFSLYANKKKIGLTKGGRLARRWQAVAYAGVVVAGLTFKPIEKGIEAKLENEKQKMEISDLKLSVVASSPADDPAAYNYN